jgi:hypothetical protein
LILLLLFGCSGLSAGPDQCQRIKRLRVGGLKVAIGQYLTGGAGAGQTGYLAVLAENHPELSGLWMKGAERLFSALFTPSSGTAVWIVPGFKSANDGFDRDTAQTPRILFYQLAAEVRSGWL